eukprot:scaffold1769_cov132-Skeletonema_dohrnii-CCMP3373.AAC.19
MSTTSKMTFYQTRLWDSRSKDLAAFRGGSNYTVNGEGNNTIAEDAMLELSRHLFQIKEEQQHVGNK